MAMTYAAIYKTYELADGRTMWELVQADRSQDLVLYPHAGVANLLQQWNANSRQSTKSRGGLWIRILVTSPKPARFFFREEIDVWTGEILPGWEWRL